MPTIRWRGNIPWNTDFPEAPLPPGAKRLQRPDNLFTASLPYGILPLLASYGVLYIKWFLLNEVAVNPLYMPIGVALGILFCVVHELLHAICYGRNQTVHIGVSLDKFAAFAVCHEPISRKRFIVMSLAPMLLGILPLLLFLIAPPSEIISGICVPMGIVGMLSPMPDYMDVHLVCRQTSKRCVIQSQNDGIYWYPV